MRKKRVYKKYYQPDPVYSRIDLSRFINYVMSEGKKTIARKAVYDALEKIKKDTKKEPMEIFEQALENALRSPLLTLSIEGAKGVLFHLSGLGDLALAEVEEVAGRIRQKVSRDAKIIFGAAKDKTLEQGEVKLLVLACGFSS